MRPLLPIALRLRGAHFVLVAAMLAGCHAQPHALAAAPNAAAGLKARSQSANRDVVSRIHAANAAMAQRDPAAIETKYGKMVEDDFSFYRGTTALFYADAAAEPGLKTTLTIPLQGDMHIENLGVNGTATGDASFDLNDFDEAAPGPYTWELARMAASLRLAARRQGLKNETELVTRFLESYRRHLASVDAKALAQPFMGTGDATVTQAIAKARSAQRPAFLANMGEGCRFKLGKKVKAVTPEVAGHVRQALSAYAKGRRESASFFTVKDVISRVSGMGSLGRYRYNLWLEGPTASPDDDVILEFKEQGAPALQPKATGNMAQRVVDAQRRFVPQADPFLGAARLQGVDFLVREMSPRYGEIDLAGLSPEAFAAYVDTAGHVVARAHARSGKAPAILGEWTRVSGAIAGFAAAYAHQVPADRAVFQATLPR